MAKLVTGIGVPHTPFFPGIAKQRGEKSRMVGLFKRVRQELESARPDLIVMMTTDHFVSFFFDNMPTFCVGAFEHADGPHELSRMMRQYRLQGSPRFAAGLVKYGIDNRFDLAFSEEARTRSRHARAAAFSHARHEHSGGAYLHQGSGRTAAASRSMPRARSDDAAIHRPVVGDRAGRNHRERKFFVGGRRPQDGICKQGLACISGGMSSARRDRYACREGYS